jgi:hypothetical protein
MYYEPFFFITQTIPWFGQSGIETPGMCKAIQICIKNPTSINSHRPLLTDTYQTFTQSPFLSIFNISSTYQSPFLSIFNISSAYQSPFHSVCNSLPFSFSVLPLAISYHNYGNHCWRSDPSSAPLILTESRADWA